MKRVVNINFKCEGLNFDAAIDCNNALKETLNEEYLPEEISEYRTNIELHCFDRNWGVRFIHYEGNPEVVVNDKEPDTFGHHHTVCDMDEIMAAAREWIKEEEEKEDAKFADKLWYITCCKDCKNRRPIISGKRSYCYILYVTGKTTTNCGLVNKWVETRKQIIEDGFELRTATVEDMNATPKQKISLRATSPMGSDCNQAFDVDGCDGMTVNDFILNVINNDPYVTINLMQDGKYIWSGEYKNQEIQKGIPQRSPNVAMLIMKVKSARAAGGWGQMSYNVKLYDSVK